MRDRENSPAFQMLTRSARRVFAAIERSIHVAPRRSGFDQRTRATAEHEDVACERIAAEALLHQQRQTTKPANVSNSHRRSG
jgi:hypothetical protein